MNFSPSTTESLAMLRLKPRAIGKGIRPHKRPVGGRPNPCAEHKEASHPLAEMARINGGRPHRRRQQLRSVTKPGYELVSDAILAGDIPVGVTITDKDVSKAIKLSVTGGMPMLALALAQHRLPARIREVGNGKWVADIL
jgi:hypothetical protein